MGKLSKPLCLPEEDRELPGGWPLDPTAAELPVISQLPHRGDGWGTAPEPTRPEGEDWGLGLQGGRKVPWVLVPTSLSLGHRALSLISGVSSPGPPSLPATLDGDKKRKRNGPPTTWQACPR